MPKSILHKNLPLIRVSQAYVLDTLLADPITGHYILTRLADDTAVVWPEYLDKLLEQLQKQGHTPKVIRT